MNSQKADQEKHKVVESKCMLKNIKVKCKRVLKVNNNYNLISIYHFIWDSNYMSRKDGGISIKTKLIKKWRCSIRVKTNKLRLKEGYLINLCNNLMKLLNLKYHQW